MSKLFHARSFAVLANYKKPGCGIPVSYAVKNADIKLFRIQLFAPIVNLPGFHVAARMTGISHNRDNAVVGQQPTGNG